jgi:hypothetical protein
VQMAMSELIKLMIDQKKKKDDADRDAEEKTRVEREDAKKKEKEGKELKKQSEQKLKSAAETSTKLRSMSSGRLTRHATVGARSSPQTFTYEFISRDYYFMKFVTERNAFSSFDSSGNEIRLPLNLRIVNAFVNFFTEDRTVPFYLKNIID